MNASYSWLRAFVPFTLSPTELRDLLTSRCATVDDVVSLREDLRDVVIARVVEAARHPNSDHLWVTKVDAGGERQLDVVCGAANVAVNTLYPFAPVGAVLPGGVKIERRKIRGETSEGMLCSARELGLGQDHEGIMALSIDATPGTRLLDAMPIGDTRLVIDVLPNRSDLLSHEGLAREIAAATGETVTRPEIAEEKPFVIRTHTVKATSGKVGDVTVKLLR
jgi:phenylalanyl-tRNA synthetase beta chain